MRKHWIEITAVTLVILTVLCMIALSATVPDREDFEKAIVQAAHDEAGWLGAVDVKAHLALKPGCYRRTTFMSAYEVKLGMRKRIRLVGLLGHIFVTE